MGESAPATWLDLCSYLAHMTEYYWGYCGRGWGTGAQTPQQGPENPEGGGRTDVPSQLDAFPAELTVVLPLAITGATFPPGGASHVTIASRSSLGLNAHYPTLVLHSQMQTQLEPA